MFYLGFAFDSDSTNTASGFGDIMGHIAQGIRYLFSLLESCVYNVVIVLYQVLFNIADSTIFSSATIKAFYGRVQLIIGIFMIFKLSISLLQAVVNPDNLSDKNKGTGNLITRILIMLVMFTAIIPLNIPLTSDDIQKKSYNYYLEQSGILFGTMYSLQNRLLKGNVIGKLVLGDSSQSYNYTDTSNSDNTLKAASQELAVFMIKAFLRPNVQKKYSEDGNYAITLDNYKEIHMCGGFSPDEKGKMKQYFNATTIDDITDFGLIAEWCNAKTGGESDNRWLLVYNPLLSIAAGIFLVVVLLSYCVECAMRALKLAILRLLAPIPIISYVDPKSESNGAFSSYVKILTSTYLDLFLRLAIIFFIIFLVREITSHGLELPLSNGIIGIISTVIIIIGMFYFAKDAPKFIKQALGIKDEGGMGLFSGLGKIAGVTSALGGAIGSAATSYKAAAKEGGHRKLSALGGFAGGLGTGLRAAATAEKEPWKASRDAQRKANAERALGITKLDKLKNAGMEMFTGSSIADKNARDIEDLETSKAALEKVKKRMSGEMVKQNWTKGSLGLQLFDKDGNTIGDVNYKSFMAAKKSAETQGLSHVKFRDVNNKEWTISMETANMQEGLLLKNNEDSYIKEVLANPSLDKVLIKNIGEAEKYGNKVTNRSSITSNIDDLDTAIDKRKRENAKYKAINSGK